MLKIKTKFIGIVIAFGIILTAAFAHAARDYLAEFLSLDTPEEQTTFVKALSEDELLIIGNQLWDKDPTGKLELWRLPGYGLKPIWDKTPPKAEKYLAIIKDDNLNPIWRGNLIGGMMRYMTYWKDKDSEELINYTFECIKNQNAKVELKRECARFISKLIYRKIQLINAFKELSMMEKQQKMDVIHFKTALIIETLINLLKENKERDEQLLRLAGSSLRSFGSRYLDQASSVPLEYRKGKGFAEATIAAKDIGPVFRQILQRKDTSMVRISHTIQALIALDLLDEISPNLINDLKKDARFSSEKDQESLLYWEKEIKKAREKLKAKNNQR